MPWHHSYTGEWRKIIKTFCYIVRSVMHEWIVSRDLLSNLENHYCRFCAHMIFYVCICSAVKNVDKFQNNLPKKIVFHNSTLYAIKKFLNHQRKNKKNLILIFIEYKNLTLESLNQEPLAERFETGNDLIHNWTWWWTSAHTDLEYESFLRQNHVLVTDLHYSITYCTMPPTMPAFLNF